VDRSGTLTDPAYKEFSENIQFFGGLALLIFGALTSPIGLTAALVGLAWLDLWIGIDVGSFGGSQLQKSRDIQSMAGLALFTVMGAMTVVASSAFYGGKSLDPVSNLLGFVSSYGGMLLVFMAYNDMMG